MTDPSYFHQLRERSCNMNIKSIFVNQAGLLNAIEFVSMEWTRPVIIEPPDLDGFFKVKVMEIKSEN